MDLGGPGVGVGDFPALRVCVDCAMSGGDNIPGNKFNLTGMKW